MWDRVKKRIEAKMRLTVSEAIVFKGFLPLLRLLSDIVLDLEMLWAKEKLIPEKMATAKPKLYRFTALAAPIKSATSGSYVV